MQRRVRQDQKQGKRTCKQVGAWTVMPFCLAIAGATLTAANPGLAQSTIVPDAMLGAENSTVTRDVVIRGILSDRVEGGAARGINLFHSFEQFNVGAGRGVYFANPAGIKNILSRVTGGNRSEILGRLGVLGNANLFLLNPNGILFGPNASLDLTGSFTATTANAIHLGDRGFFSATQPQQSTLLAVAPGALLYNQIAAQGGRITNTGNLAAGQDLTLAANNLNLEGQLQAGRDLTLQAQDTVRIRDSATVPFIASAGRNLLVQGNQTVDIFALNHPNSGLFSGGDMVLRSANTVGGDAHYYSDGNFRIEQLDRSQGNLLSPNDPIVLAGGNVELGDYEGASLHILAGGSIILGNVTITGLGEANTTINPNNPTLFNGTRSYADLATVNLTDYRATFNSDGTVSSVDPVQVPITINGSTQATLDVRAGVDWAKLGGLPTSSIRVGAVIPAPNYPDTLVGTVPRADIIVNGNIRVNQPNGLVLLTNQFSPNSLTGTISARGIDTSTQIAQANGGDIRVYGRGDITIIGDPNNRSNLNSSSDSDFGDAGNGGAISFATRMGNITLIDSVSDSRSVSDSFFGDAGNGGVISFTTHTGNITLISSSLSSSSDSLAFRDFGDAGNGGAISFTTYTGNITLTDSNLSSFSSSDSFSFSGSGNSGNGGAISFATLTGNITLANSTSTSTSFADFGDVGNGGAVLFATSIGNITLIDSDLASSSLAGETGDGGSILFVTRAGDITLTNSDLKSQSFTDNSGNGGTISLITYVGNITLTDSDLASSSATQFSNPGNGGTISLITYVGNITLTDSDLASSSATQFSDAGNGGAISLSAREGMILGSSSSLNSFAASGQRDSGYGGRVTLEANREVSGLEITTLASGGISGDVEVKGFGDLLIADTQVLTAQQLNIRFCPTCDLTTINLSERGQAGNVAVTSIGNLTFHNSVLQSDTRSGNPAGNITVNSPDLLTFDSSQVISNTSSTGQAGNITVTAGKGVSFTGTASGLFAQTNSPGKAGNIALTAPQLTLQQNAQISTTATATSTNLQGGGSISINASDIYLAGVVGVFAETQGQTPAGTLTISPYTNQSALNLTLAPQSQISASTSSSGNGGDLILTAPQAITISGQGKLAVETTGSGNAGNITIATQQLTLKDGVELSASTSGSGKAGNLTITADNFNLLQGAKITTTTSSSGKGGDITINLSRDYRANDGQILATADRSGGGSINIIANSIRLQGNSDIKTNVFSGASDGGNITLTARSILAFNDSDILAFAQDGVGGNITLNTRAFFGQNYRPASFGTDPRTLDNNNRVDINASGAVSGIVTLPDVTFIQNSLTQLPQVPIDTNALLANSCIVRRNQPTGNFFVTGSGGLPERPGTASLPTFPTGEVQNVEDSEVRSQKPEVKIQNSNLSTQNSSARRPWTIGDPIAEPDSVYQLPDGQLVLSHACP